MDAFFYCISSFFVPFSFLIVVPFYNVFIWVRAEVGVGGGVWVKKEANLSNRDRLFMIN